MKSEEICTLILTIQEFCYKITICSFFPIKTWTDDKLEKSSYLAFTKKIQFPVKPIQSEVKKPYQLFYNYSLLLQDATAQKGMN